MTRCDAESWKFFDYRPREWFLSGFPVTRCHTVTPGKESIMNNARYRTAEVARLAEVTLRQLQVWEEKRVAIASRSGRVRMYTASEAMFVIVVAELRRRGLSLQRLRRLSPPLRQLLKDHEVVARRARASTFILTDGRQIQYADSPNKTLELVSNFFRPIMCVNLGNCLDRLEKTGVAE